MDAEPHETMGDGNVYIKEEPQDEEDFSAVPQYHQPQQPAALSSFDAPESMRLTLPLRPPPHSRFDIASTVPRSADELEPIEAPRQKSDSPPSNFFTSQRAKDEDGNDAPTVCFEGALLFTPLRHQLMCTHIVTTKNAEPCGSNCMVSRTAMSKGRGQNFLCPHPSCVNVRKKEKQAMPKIRHRGRKCEVNHVYGLDPVADRKHRAEQDAREIGLSRKLRKRKPEMRERSRSPAADRVPDSSRRARSPLRSHPTIEREHELVQRYGREIIDQLKSSGILCGMQQTGHTRVHFGSVQQLLQNEKLIREMNRLHIDGKTALLSGSREVAEEAERIREATDAERDKQRPHAHMQSSMATSESIRRRNAFNWSMPENELAAMEAEEGSIIMELETTDAGGNAALDADAGGVMEETHCMCGMPADAYMIPCDECFRNYHPSCLDKGVFGAVDYAGKQREACLERDAAVWRGNDEKFLCRVCDPERQKQAQQLADEILGRRRR